MRVQVMEVAGVSVHDSAPWDSSLSVGQALMIPTTIYVNDVLKLHNAVCAFSSRPSCKGSGCFLPRSFE
jgi:phosphoribosylaminoimidazole (AIR) synthetase